MVVLLSSGVVLYMQQNPNRPDFATAKPEKIHYADDPSLKINSIAIKAFYFLPTDRKDQMDDDWQKHLNDSLAGLKEFYTLQLNNAVKITFDIYPQPIIGQYETAYYDRQEGQGNPMALLAIQKELTNRVFSSSGDLYEKFFAEGNSDSFRVMGILYQGVGSTATIFKKNGGADNLAVLEEGTLPAFLVSDYYLTTPSYKDYGQTIFAHEFGHTLGLPDAYDIKTGIPYSDDIMGEGRYRPLNIAHLSVEAKKKLGLTY